MLRRLLRSLAALALVLPFVTVAQTEPLTLAPGLTLGPPRPVSDFRFGGVAGGDRVVGAVPRGDGFLVFEIAANDLRTVQVNATGRADVANARVVFRNAALPTLSFRMATNGSRVVYFWTEAGQARFSSADADGLPVTPAGIPIPGATQVSTARCNPSRCVVSYYDQKFLGRSAIVDLDGSIVATGLDLRGNVIGVDDHGFLLRSTTGAGTQASQYETHFTRIDDEGRQTFEVVRGGALGSVVALAPPGSSTYAIVWSNSQPSPTTLQAATLTLDGRLSEPRNLLTNAELSPAGLVWNGSEFLLAFHVGHFRYVIPESTQPADLFVQRLSPAVAPLGAPVQVSTSSEANYLATLVANGGSYYAGWNEYPNGGFNPIARGAVLDAHANVVAREPFTIGPMPQSPLALAIAGDRALTIWGEHDSDRGVDRLLYARSNTSDATPLDEQPFVLEEGHDFRIAAAALGSDVLLVWEVNQYDDAPLRAIHMAIVHTADGSHVDVPLPPLDPPGIALRALAAASNGESWLATVGSLYFRISRAGIVLTPTRSTFSSAQPNTIAIASDGSSFFVLWNRYGFSCTNCGGLSYSLIDADGRVVKREQPIASGPLEGQVDVAFNGREYLAVSVDSDTLHLRRFAREGALLSSTSFNRNRASVQWPLVTPLGSAWFVAWSILAAPFSNGVRVTAEGTVAGSVLTLPLTAALEPRRDGSALALTASRINVPPYGTGTAATLQELLAEGAPRRRAAGSR